ncbi:MAG: hypothetical protein H0X62_05640 [Bacteroidetes bacterium]|nr:hypothetical protein [Bacteroidota bacterium]
MSDLLKNKPSKPRQTTNIPPNFSEVKKWQVIKKEPKKILKKGSIIVKKIALGLLSTNKSFTIYLIVKYT